jgi:hypothetical protein
MPPPDAFAPEGAVCQNCRTLILPGARYCQRCGVETVAAAPMARDQPQLVSDASADRKLNAKAHGPRPVALGIGLAVAVAVGVFAMVRLFATGTATPNRSQPSSTPSPATISNSTVAIPPGAAQLAANTLVAWEESTLSQSNTYVFGGLILKASGRVTADGRVPTLEVTAPTGEAITASGVLGFEKPAMKFAVGKIDPDSPIDQILLTSYSGGAHCCTDFKLIDFLDGRWRVVDLGSQDGDGPENFPKDIDGDGRVDLVSGDDRFLYTFAAYAFSRSPPFVRNVVHGVVIDVSTAPRYRPQYQSQLADAQKDCEQKSNGACPAFVAIAARLGLADQAWPIMLSHFDRTSDWTLPTACHVPLQDSQCPKGEEIEFRTYPEALRWFLGATGYLPPAYLPPKEPGIGPSFDCGRVTSQNLKLICENPALSADDRELARLYTRLLALSPQTGRSVSEERAFITMRNNAAADVSVLSAIYEQRLDVLRGQVGG